jgi:hypothetical protein
MFFNFGKESIMDMRNSNSKMLLVVAFVAVLATLGCLAWKKPSDVSASAPIALSAEPAASAVVVASAGNPEGGFKLVKAEAIQEGVVYADGNGNTFQQERAGDRLCRFHVNGQLRKEEFVSGKDPETTKRMCDARGELFKQSMTAYPKPEKKK